MITSERREQSQMMRNELRRRRVVSGSRIVLFINGFKQRWFIPSFILIISFTALIAAYIHKITFSYFHSFIHLFLRGWSTKNMRNQFCYCRISRVRLIMHLLANYLSGSVPARAEPSAGLSIDLRPMHLLNLWSNAPIVFFLINGRVIKLL